MNTGLIVAAIVLLVALGLGAWMTTMYNGMVRLRQVVNEGWATIDVAVRLRPAPDAEIRDRRL